IGLDAGHVGAGEEKRAGQAGAREGLLGGRAAVPRDDGDPQLEPRQAGEQLGGARHRRRARAGAEFELLEELLGLLPKGRGVAQAAAAHPNASGAASAAGEPRGLWAGEGVRRRMPAKSMVVSTSVPSRSKRTARTPVHGADPDERILTDLLQRIGGRVTTQ